VTEPISPQDAVIQMDGVTRRFNGVRAIHDLSLRVEPGSIVGLIGPSGSGKTTAVRMLTGTLEPTDGAIRVLGEDPRRFSRRVRERIAYMPQLFSLYADLTAHENVSFVASLYGRPWWSRRGAVRRALEVVDLWDARRRLARNLSGGMQRRLELACAVVHDPQVLFIDEPTAGVDPLLRRAIWDELRRMRDEGRTLLVTTQYVGEAEYCDRIALLAEGELVAMDEPAALRRAVFGGEVLELDADQPLEPDAVANVAEVLAVRQSRPRRLVLVVSDAGVATPRIVEALAGRGIGVISLEEYQPSFDDIFSELVERQRAGREEADRGERHAA
jgi:ABC-2 type transport system ATP-binding protein